jgi:hypothetical protein
MSKTRFSMSSSIIAVVFLAIASFTGCAGYNAQSKESLLSAAGFQTRTPTTPKQVVMFQRMTPYKLERRVRNGKVLYAFADPQQNLVYIGGESEYQKYRQISLQRQIAEDQLEAAQINEETSLYDWGPYWGPWNIWW